jgi:hypothetical protein
MTPVVPDETLLVRSVKEIGNLKMTNLVDPFLTQSLGLGLILKPKNLLEL